MTPDPEPGSERLRDGLNELKRSLATIDSVRPEVERRIAAASMRPALPVRSLAAGSVIVLAIVSALWWRAPGNRMGPSPDQLATAERLPAQLPPEQLRLTVSGAEVVAHVAAVVDGRAVLVAWSVRGGDGAAGGMIETKETRAGKYRRRLFPAGKLADGRAIACGVYVPDAGVHPVLEPPTVVAHAGGGQLVAFSTPPRVAADSELTASLRSLGLSEEVGVSLAGIRKSIRELAEQ